MGLKARSKPVVLYSVVSNLIIYQKLEKSQPMWLQGKKVNKNVYLLFLSIRVKVEKLALV